MTIECGKLIRQEHAANTLARTYSTEKTLSINIDQQEKDCFKNTISFGEKACQSVIDTFQEKKMTFWVNLRQAIKIKWKDSKTSKNKENRAMC
jgi:hypothetical protein